MPGFAPGADAGERFERLAREWEEGTTFLSSAQQIALHDAYQQIIGMGPAALPFVFARMRGQPGHWFWALHAITGDDPVRPEHRGDVPAMTRDWLEWAAAVRLAQGPSQV